MANMNASEARRMGQRNIKNVCIDPIIAIVDKKILDAAAGGLFLIKNPLHGVGFEMRSTTFDEREAVRLHYVHLGYRWIEYGDPDLGNPTSSGAFTKLEW